MDLPESERVSERGFEHPVLSAGGWGPHTAPSLAPSLALLPTAPFPAAQGASQTALFICWKPTEVSFTVSMKSTCHCASESGFWPSEIFGLIFPVLSWPMWSPSHRLPYCSQTFQGLSYPRTFALIFPAAYHRLPHNVPWTPSLHVPICY